MGDIVGVVCFGSCCFKVVEDEVVFFYDVVVVVVVKSLAINCKNGGVGKGVFCGQCNVFYYISQLCFFYIRLGGFGCLNVYLVGDCQCGFDFGNFFC